MGISSFTQTLAFTHKGIELNLVRWQLKESFNSVERGNSKDATHSFIDHSMTDSLVNFGKISSLKNTQCKPIYLKRGFEIHQEIEKK